MTEATAASFQALLDEVPFASAFHYRVMSLGGGECTLAVPFQRAHERPGGIVSGQVYMCAADVAFWGAIKGELGLEDGSVSIDIQTSFLAPARQEEISCTARISRVARRLVFGTAECHGADGRLLTTHSLTYARPPDAA